MGKIPIVTICLLAIWLAVLPPAACGAADSAALSAAKEYARSEVWKTIAAGRAGSATIAIMDNGVTVYAEGFGMADREKSVPVDKNTLFNMGSISKVYVATAIMLLVDDGKVRLDAPVTAYLPEFTMLDERYKDITVRMLLNHSSGLPGNIGLDSVGYRYNTELYRTMLAILAQSHLKHRPGELAPYCNDGFTLAEMIVAKVSGMSYPAFLQQRIFAPLALKYTGTGVGDRANKNLVVARGYTAAGRGLPPEVVSHLGSGGLSATAEDLCRFADSFSPVGRHILSPAALAEMKKVQPADIAGKLMNPPFTFGLGWDLAEIPALKARGLDVLGKSGGTCQYNSMLYTIPDKRISVAAIFTGDSAGAMNFAYGLLECYLAGKGLLPNAPATVEAPVKGEAMPPELAAYEGYYTNGGGLTRVVLDRTANTLAVFGVADGRESELYSGAYQNGFFHSPAGLFSFAAVDGRAFLIQHLAAFKIDKIVGEKLERPAAPLTLAGDIDGRRWLRRNVKASEFSLNGYADYVLTSRLLAPLPGYIDFAGVKKVTGPTTAGFAVSALRDLDELSLLEENGVPWAWLSGLLYSAAESAATLAGGPANLAIGDRGDNEWLRLGQDAVLSFTKPANGRILVFDPAGSLIYDSLTDSGDVFAAAGSFVAVAGEPGDAFTVLAR